MATASPRILPNPPSYQPVSPAKKDPALKPNPHPYAIKTASTALLSRSGSSGHNINATHHYYIPPSPSHTRNVSKGHRSTRSLNAVPESPGREAPRPLPIPPDLDYTQARRDGSGGSGGYVSADELSRPPRRPRRSSTLPVISVPSPAPSGPSPIEDLPGNPKVWTPSQLATYLTTALRLTSGAKTGEMEPIGLPALVAKDIATFVKSARIGGRAFLRLNDEDLEALGMNKKWRDALLVAARNLRQNILKGRIWNADITPVPSPAPSSFPASVSSPQIDISPSSSPPIRKSVFYSNPAFNSSSSSVDSSASMSAGEGEEEGYTDGAPLGRSKARRYRNGRVRGMIESFERSGSFSSDGGFEDEGGASFSSPERTTARKWIREQAQAQVQLTGQRVVESPSPSRRRPLPVPPSPSGSNTLVNDEPTTEALLAEVAKQQPMTGARAWEVADLANGVTMKRVPEQEAMIGQKTISGLGSGRSSGGSSNGKAAERRVVTAIFSPQASDAPSAPRNALDAAAGLSSFAENTSIPTPPLDEQEQLSPFKSKSRPLPPPPVPEGVQTEPEPELEIADAEAIELERMLEEEILATRTLVDTFRARLEIVEQKVADLEALRASAELAPAQALAPEVVLAGSLATDAPQSQSQSQSQSSPPPSEGQARDRSPQSQSHSQSHHQYQSSAAALAANPSGPRVSVEIGVQSEPPQWTGAVLVEAAIQTGRNEFVDGGDPPLFPLRQVSRSGTAAAEGPLSRPGASHPRSRSDAVGRGKSSEGEEAEHPSYMADLPSYVLLVGLGVCAVVTHVVLRRVFGKGWRP